jgi:hypothetical protein
LTTINSTYINETSRARAERGLRIEGIAEAQAHSLLFRFFLRADFKDATLLSSPWWFQAAVVRRILDAARRSSAGGRAVAEQAKNKAGLSKSWLDSGAHYLLTAEVVSPISLFWGSPRPVGRTGQDPLASGLADHADVGEVEVVPDSKCVQFYVPGTWDERMRPRMLRVVSRAKFKHSAELEAGDIEGFLQRVSGI